MSDKKTKLKILMQQMHDLTLPECKNTCKLPLSCCSPEYCGITYEYSKDKWGVELVATDHPTLPFMGPNGCIVEPHLRPLCTVHTCEINSMGFKRGPGGVEWTEKYFKLREEINQMDFEISENDS